MGPARDKVINCLSSDEAEYHSLPKSSYVLYLQAKRRWLLMLRHVPCHHNLTFVEKLEYLVDKFLPELKNKEVTASVTQTETVLEDRQDGGESGEESEEQGMTDADSSDEESGSSSESSSSDEGLESEE